MKLQQLRYICEVARRGFNVSAAAERLYTAQSGISTQIRLLEEELGLPIFLRHGKRLVGATPEGERIIAMAQRVLAEAEGIRRFAAESRDAQQGALSVAATHTHAHHVLPRLVRRFAREHPEVRLRIHEGTAAQVLEMVGQGQADLGVLTAPEDVPEDLLVIPREEWRLTVITPPDHPLTREPLSLEALAAHPLVTYDQALPGRRLLNRAFDAAGLVTRVALTAMDADTIKTYVALGLGVGVVWEAAVGPGDEDLCRLEAGHLFAAAQSCLCLHRRRYLPACASALVQALAPHLAPGELERALAGEEGPP